MRQHRYPVIDMHCDLLSFLTEKRGRDPFSPLSNASLPQLKDGYVALQVMAHFTSNGPDAPRRLRQQVEAFVKLTSSHPTYIQPFDPSLVQNGKMYILAAFENATGLSDDSAPIAKVIEELSSLKKLLGPIAYISMTWDGENRFGGGVASSKGLKSDGEHLLEFMNEKHIPIDVSHASDFLIDDIFNHIDRKGFTTPVIASHSNFRQVTAMARNLSDDMAKEIIKRKGLIGLNFFCHFSGGKKAEDILVHITHALDLAGDAALCLGADFFSDSDAPYIKEKYQSDKCFYPELGNSSCYTWLFNTLEERLGFSHEAIEKISYKNAEGFLKKHLGLQLAR